jgi:hypothetical protein
MENESVNIRQTIAMYWEADRSSVKARYDALFPHPPEEEVVPDDPDNSRAGPQQEQEPQAPEPVAQDWESVWDTDFREAVRDIGFSDPIAQKLLEAWDKLSDAYRPVALHHLVAATFAGWSLAYSLEGLTNFFDVWIATHVMHAISPETHFPVALDPSYRRLKMIFRTLGISYDGGEGQSATDVAANICDAVAEFNKKSGMEPWQTWALTYDLGPRLLPDPAPYPTETPPRVWIVSANEPGGDFEHCDRHTNSDVFDWCINSKAKRGDIALMYHLAPRSAFVGVYRCFSDAYDDPLRGPDVWTGGCVEITDRIALPWIALKEMKNDPTLKNWGLVKRNFVGMLQSEVPPDTWNRIKELVAQKDPEVGQFLERYAAAAGGVHSIAAIGEDISEQEVEDSLVLPLLHALGWDIHENLTRQFEMDIKIGSGKPKRVRADFVGFRDALCSEALVVIETKYRIQSDTQLSSAVGQCESYAGKLRCPRFAVAAPEGIWIYQMNFPGYSTLLAQLPLQREVSPLTMQKIIPLLEFNTLRAGGK